MNRSPADCTGAVGRGRLRTAMRAEHRGNPSAPYGGALRRVKREAEACAAKEGPSGAFEHYGAIGAVQTLRSHPGWRLSARRESLRLLSTAVAYSAQFVQPVVFFAKRTSRRDRA